MTNGIRHTFYYVRQKSIMQAFSRLIGSTFLVMTSDINTINTGLGAGRSEDAPTQAGHQYTQGPRCLNAGCIPRIALRLRLVGMPGYTKLCIWAHFGRDKNFPPAYRLIAQLVIYGPTR